MDSYLSSLEQYFSHAFWRKTGVILVVIVLAVSLRLILFDSVNIDITEVFSIWYNNFLQVGRFDAFGEIFYNYSPATLYLYDIMTLFTFLPAEYGIKIISVLFDFLGGLGVMRIVQLKYPRSAMPLIAFSIFLFLPTVFIDSAMWGQSDIIYTTFLIWSFYFILKQKNWPAMFFFSISFCFKLQAMFFAPVFLILFLRRKFPFYLFFMIPVVYFISNVPAWIAGSPLGKLLTIYFTQFETYQELNRAAPNLYIYFPSHPANYNLIVLIGLVLTLLIVLTYVVLRWRRWQDLGSASLCFDAAFFTLLIPFLLPKMHDRYFYAACLFLFILCFYEFRTIGLMLLGQVSSVLAYIVFLTALPEWFVKIAAPFTLLAVVGLFWHFKQHINELKDVNQIGLSTANQVNTNEGKPCLTN